MDRMSGDEYWSPRHVVFVIVGGALLVGVAVVGVPWLTADTHRHTASVTEDAPIDEGSQYYYHYEELSAEGQDIVRRTVDAESAVYTAEPAAPEFAYPGGSEFELYVVEYRNTTYVFETGVDPTPLQFPPIAGGLLLGAIVGVLLVALGGYPILRAVRNR